MRTAPTGARLRLMDNGTGVPTPRGQRLIDRLARLGISEMSERELSKVLRIARETWDSIQQGNARPSSYEKAEDGLAAYIEEHGLEGEDEPKDEASTGDVHPADFMELELTVDAVGLHIIGKGSPANMDEVRRQIADLYREIRGKGE